VGGKGVDVIETKKEKVLWWAKNRKKGEGGREKRQGK